MKLQLQRAIALLNDKKPKVDKAMQALRPVLKKKKAPWPAYHYMGLALFQKKEYGNALNFLQEALRRGSDEPETYHLISMTYLELGDLPKAEKNGQEALKRRPEFFKAWLNLGSVYRAQAKLEQALKCFQKANQLDPRSAGVAFRIAAIYRDQGDIKKALELFDIALKIDGEYLEVLAEKARIYQKIRKFDEARECLDRILEKKPGDLDARVTYAEVFRAEGRYEEAISRYEDILSEYPAFAAVRVNYALALQEIGRFNESEKHYLKAFEDQSDSVEAVSNYLMGLHYNPERTREEIFEAHLEWDKHFAPAERPSRPVPEDWDPERPLRIGLLSGGFWRHPVGWMITPALENLPKDQFEIYCYTTNNLSDELTRRIHAVSDSWKSVIGYKEDVIARMIRDDGIDILVELSGHSADNRLRTVALEPAPVIVKWVGGLFNTSGLCAMDYLITDRHESPEGEEPFYTEKLVRMPDDYICFLPPDYAPEVGVLPAKTNGYVTYGCFNNPTKVNPVLLEKWAEIMNRVPDSRLILKSKQYDTRIFTRRIEEQMESLGISADRLEFEGHSPHTDLLEMYNKVDIALDPWPYSGGLSTCEALWMGVPVVTMPGPTFAGRHSATHLANAGLPDLVVESWNDYVAKAVDLAGDLDKLEKLRSGLREKVRNSPLCDGERFGANLAVALREMWKQRVAGWESGRDEWRDHIAVEAVEVVEAVETKTSEQRESGQSGAETGYHEEPKSGEADVETEDSEERESGERFDQAENTEQQESGKSINKKEVDEKAEVAPSSSGNGTHQVSDDMPANGHGVHSRGKNGSDRNDKSKTWKIETKDDVVICTPADLNMLTPYVLLEQEQWYEPELQFVRDYLKPGMNAVDVGAGFGVYALPMAKKVGPEGKVYAFEPGSLCRRHLEMSKLENGFDNIEIIGKAVFDHSGKHPWKIADIPEQNKLDESGKEEVSVVALDAWWQFDGEPQVDLLKIDINGEEKIVLTGAHKLIMKEKPLLMISISKQKSEEFVEDISSLGYLLYEYVAGANVLVEHDATQGTDSYMQNLVAVHESQRESLKEAGWLYDEAVTVSDPDVDLWKTELTKLPWTDELMKRWKSMEVSGGVIQYLKALNYLVTAEQIDVYGPDSKQKGSKKARLILEAAQILISLYNQGANSTSMVFTLVRTLHALGKRGQAVEVMQKLIETTSLGQENMNTDLPFMLSLSDQDHAPVKTDLSKWLMVRMIEAWIQLKDLSSYLSSPKERQLIEVLEGNPEISDSFFGITLVNKVSEKRQLTENEKKTLTALISTQKECRKESKERLDSHPFESILSDRSNTRIFNRKFWNETLTPLKAKKVVELTQKFNKPEFSSELLKIIIQETEHRLKEGEDDNVAFFIQTHALLAINNKFNQILELDKELENALKEKEWIYKSVLYNYWFDKIEYRRIIKKPEVTAVIISNRFKEKTVENLKRLNQQLRGRGEIIFVNNGIDDKEFSSLIKYVDTYVKTKGNSGAYLARNLGAIFAKGKYLLFVDDDGIPDEGFVDAHLDIRKEREVIVSRGAYYSDKPKNDPWHYNLGDKEKPAITYLEGNAVYNADPFYLVGGWGDYILFGHGGMELSFRLLSFDSNKEKQVYAPKSKLNHNYFREVNHQKNKTDKQSRSFYLLNNLHSGLESESTSWPVRFSDNFPVLDKNKVTIWLLDPGLHSPKGHHFTYAKEFARFAKENGHQLCILTHLAFNEQRLLNTPTVPVFSHTPYNFDQQMIIGIQYSNRSTRGVLTHMLSSRIKPGDKVIMHTTGIKHLQGVLSWYKELEINSSVDVNICFQEEMTNRFSTPQPKLEQLTKDLLNQAAVFYPKLKICTTTEPVANVYGKILGYKPDVVGCIVQSDLLNAEKPSESKRERELLYISSGRDVQGVSLILKLAQKIYHNPDEFKLTVHTGLMSEPLKHAFKEVRNSHINVIEQDDPAYSYKNLIVRSEAVLLPYCPIHFKDKMSGILLDVLAAKTPVITTQGTYLNTFISQFNEKPGVTMKAYNLESLNHAIREFINNGSTFKQAAIAAGKYVRSHFNADNVIKKTMAES